MNPSLPNWSNAGVIALYTSSEVLAPPVPTSMWANSSNITENTVAPRDALELLVTAMFRMDAIKRLGRNPLASNAAMRRMSAGVRKARKCSLESAIYGWKQGASMIELERSAN